MNKKRINRYKYTITELKEILGIKGKIKSFYGSVTFNEFILEVEE